MTRALAFALISAIFALSACDNREALHAPDFTLARMQEQPRIDPFEAMREVPPFTVPRGESEHSPPPVSRTLLEAGRLQFDTHCAPCHGVVGDGLSVVAEKMLTRPPPSLHEERIRALTDRQIYDVVSHGYGLMPGYSWQLHEGARWGIVHYVRALQLSQSIAADQLPQSMQDELAREAR